MSDPKNTETDKMPGFGTNPSMSFASIPARVEYNASNNVPSEYIFDQGLCYPAANSYAYYAGFEPPGEWVDGTSFLGSDGQNLQLSGLQNESLPYTYYLPGYGTAYSSPDQYNAYMSGMAMGVDGLFVGTQQYFASPFYQPPGSPSGYFPIFVQPAADFVPDVSSELPLFGSGQSVVSRPPNASIKNRRQITRNTAAPYQNAASGNPTTDLSWSSHQNQNTNKLSDLLGINVPRCDTSSSSHVTIQVSASSAGKDGHSTEATHSTNHMSPGSTSFQNSEVTSHGWTSGEKYVAKVENGNPNVLFEQNGGPKMNRSVVPSMSAAAGEGGPSIAASSSAVENIVIHPDQYNKDDFPVDYPDAKFFVIKSYSEDDVHKSIKYNVWSSTPNGNRRLDAAYSDARGRSLGKPRNCPIFLFFSVNTSGQFCGVAEMVGPVDFHKDVDFWQQDKWSGSFPVKWHIIKDVLNSSFRHIILENNENKPVTNSRDTQEILYKSGINMLKIFKNSPMTTSVLDDFPFYEARQKAMLEEKCRCLGRSSDVLFCVPAVVAKSSASVVGEPCEFVKCQFSIKDPLSGKIEQECGTSKQPDNLDQMKNDTVASVLKRDGVQPAKQAQQLYTGRDIESTADQQIEKCSSYAASENGSKPAGLDRLIEVNGKGPDEHKAQSEENPSKSNDSSDKKGLAEKLDGHASLDCRKDGTDGLVGDMKFTHLVMKPQALATWMEGEAKSPGNTVMGISPTGVVKVGSVHIKVNEAGESSSEILGVVMDSLEPKGAKHTVEYMSTNENLVKSV